MGLIYADIELVNSDGLALASGHITGEEEVIRMHINILVNTGPLTLIINESIQE